MLAVISNIRWLMANQWRQSHEIQKIAHKIISYCMLLDEQFQVAVIIDKLPPSLKIFKNFLGIKLKNFP